MTDPKPVRASLDPADATDDTDIRRHLADEFASTCQRVLHLPGQEDVDWYRNANEDSLYLTWDLGGGSRGYETLVAAARKMDRLGSYLEPQPWGLKITWDDVSQDLGVRGNKVSAEVQAQNRGRAPLSLKEDASTGDWPSLPLSRDSDTWIRETSRFLLTIRCEFNDVAAEWRSRQGQDLRSKVIRLAAQNAEIRPHLLRLLKP